MLAKKFGLYLGLVLSCEEKLCADWTNHTIAGVGLLHFLLPITSVLQSQDDHKRGCSLIERFSNDCRKTKTKTITPTNHDRGKQRDEPITIPSNHL